MICRPGTSSVLAVVAMAAIAVTGQGTAVAQETLEGPVRMVERDLSGPRFGFTFRPNERVEGDDVGRVVSQFGWHFEHHVSADAGGPQFVTQFVPLVAGVEYGKVVPSVSFGVGLRLPNGYEFGLGPSVSPWRNGLDQARLRSALFLAVGRSFDYNGVNIPVNVVLTTNSDGSRASVLVGYAIRRATRSIES